MVEEKVIVSKEKELLLCILKAFRILRFALPLDTFSLVSSCDTAHDIWNRLKELYTSDDDLLHSTLNTLLSKFGSFEQKPDDLIEHNVTRFNHLLSRMMKHRLERKVIK